MEDYTSMLLEWTIFYVKNKDLIKKEIKDYKILRNFVEFEYKDKKHTYYIFPELTSEIFEKSEEGFGSVVCLNKKENLDFAASNWEKLTKNPHFSIIFVNPKANQKWIIYPHTHNKIAEKRSLKLGLLSLFEGVERVI